MTAISITYPAEQYVERGVCASTSTSTEWWADTFHSLGGESCIVQVGWQTGIPGTATALVEGSDPAIEFVLDQLIK